MTPIKHQMKQTYTIMMDAAINAADAVQNNQYSTELSSTELSNVLNILLNITEQFNQYTNTTEHLNIPLNITEQFNQYTNSIPKGLGLDQFIICIQEDLPFLTIADCLTFEKNNGLNMIESFMEQW